jgi:hypothetical protein
MPRFLRLLPALALLAAPLSPALAHAILVESAPAANAKIPAGHVAITLRFNSRIDAPRSRVTLAGQQGEAALKRSDSHRPDLLTGSADLAPGAYVLHWQVLAVDGHITRGTVPFTAAAEGGN